MLADASEIFLGEVQPLNFLTNLLQIDFLGKHPLSADVSDYFGQKGGNIFRHYACYIEKQTE